MSELELIVNIQQTAALVSVLVFGWLCISSHFDVNEPEIIQAIGGVLILCAPMVWVIFTLLRIWH